MRRAPLFGREFMKHTSRLWNIALVATLVLVMSVQVVTGQDKRPMTFMDIINMQSVGNATVSPTGSSMLFTRSITDWKSGKNFSDLYLVSVDEGIDSTRQMTYTKGKNETNPRWSTDGNFFVFASDRESGGSDNQLFLMRPDGGEARRITDAKDGVSRFAFSYDGLWLAYTAGKEDDRSVWAIRLADIDDPEPIHLIDHYAPVIWWEFAPDSQRVYFIAPDSVDKDNRTRMKENFDVMIRNEDSALEHLWSFDMSTREKDHLTDTNDYAVSGVTLSRDSKWVAFQGTPNDRYMRTVTERGIHADNYLLEVETGEIERLTENEEIRESTVQFSSDSSMLAFSASNDFTYNRDQKIWVRSVDRPRRCIEEARRRIRRSDFGRVLVEGRFHYLLECGPGRDKGSAGRRRSVRGRPSGRRRAGISVGGLRLGERYDNDQLFRSGHARQYLHRVIHRAGRRSVELETVDQLEPPGGRAGSG